MAGSKILVVEDDLDMQSWLRVQLEARGYDVALASDGALALIAARKERPNAIVLDIGLPGGDGFVVMNRLRSIKPVADVPIIVITGTTERAGYTKKETSAAGAAAYFRKPVDPDELDATIQRLLQTPPGAEPGPS